MRRSATYGQTSDIWGNDHSSVECGRVDIQRSLSCSHDQISFSEYCLPSANSTPASTPELTRRSNGLSRSRSQPCVLNDKKVGIKRRRPEEAKEQRPSLDLAKMTQIPILVLKKKKDFNSRMTFDIGNSFVFLFRERDALQSFMTRRVIE
ncbi:hypothetical protein lerEdw1_007778 [Lerista edwardsae]|nr:hypothetical protein lerEdw1_007778 [Lerista edwardsae]